MAQVAYLKASNPRQQSFFGRSLALSGDTLAVGASSEAGSRRRERLGQTDASAPRAGAVYVFTRTGSTWSQQAYVKASNTATTANFGWSVALSGDTLAVGAKGEGSSATGVGGAEEPRLCSHAVCGVNSGAAYAFVRTGAGAPVWSQQAYIKASNARPEGGFGNFVALEGDTLAVGENAETRVPRAA